MEDGSAAPFPRFREALRENPDAAKELAPTTFYRFAKGELPANLEWFLEHPKMLRALLQDAEAMSDKEWANYRKVIRSRSKAAKSRRGRDSAVKKAS